MGIACIGDLDCQSNEFPTLAFRQTRQYVRLKARDFRPQLPDEGFTIFGQFQQFGPAILVTGLAFNQSLPDQS